MDTERWHTEEKARYALTVAELIADEPLLTEAAQAQEPTKLLRCPQGHRLFALTPDQDDHGRVVLKVRSWVDPRILQPSYPGARPRHPTDGTPGELEPKVTLACTVRRCAFRRDFHRSDLLRFYAVHLYRRGDIVLPA